MRRRVRYTYAWCTGVLVSDSIGVSLAATQRTTREGQVCAGSFLHPSSTSQPAAFNGGIGCKSLTMGSVRAIKLLSEDRMADGCHGEHMVCV
uniref:Putative secreted protein n=1 Tax=Anopheles darlingi TaxID=43151 RepID=A0A2M4DJE5_ANODA